MNKVLKCKINCMFDCINERLIFIKVTTAIQSRAVSDFLVAVSLIIKKVITLGECMDPVH